MNRSLTANVLAVFALVALGCSRLPVSGNAPETGPVASTARLSDTKAASAAAACTPAPPSNDPERERVLDDIAAARLRDASDTLVAQLADHPGDRVANALDDVVRAYSKARTRAGTNALASMSAVMLPSFPANPPTHAALPAHPAAKLVLVSSKKTEAGRHDWLAKDRNASRYWRASADAAQSYAGHRLFHTFTSPDGSQVARYGQFLVAYGEGQPPRVFDASAVLNAGGHRLDVNRAAVVDRTLYVSVAAPAYAKDVSFRAGYLVAFAVDTGALLWSSDPLVSNRDFVVAGPYIVTGYGFTAEPDALFLIDARTGRTEHTLPLDTAPEELVVRDGQLFARTSETDYTIRLEGPAAPALPSPVVAAGGLTATERERRCWLSSAVAAIEARDSMKLAQAAAGLAAKSEDASLADALRASERADQLDLSAEPLVLAPPPWSYTVAAPPAPQAAADAHLVRISKTKSPPPSDDRVRLASLLADVDEWKLPAGVRKDVPVRFGRERLHRAIDSGDRLVLIYGERWLVSVRDTKVERIFDFDAFLHPPRISRDSSAYIASEGLTHARVEGSVLYTCNGGGSYAKDVYGKKGFLSAIESATGKLLWRSDPLVCDNDFLSVDDYLVAGYGFTGEPSRVVMLRKSDGRTVQSITTETAPLSFEMKDGLVHVDVGPSVYAFRVAR